MCFIGKSQDQTIWILHYLNSRREKKPAFSKVLWGWGGGSFMGEGSNTAFLPAAGWEYAQCGMKEKWCRAKWQGNWNTRKTAVGMQFSSVKYLDTWCQHPMFILIHLLYMSVSKKLQLENTTEIVKSQPKVPLWFSPLIPRGEGYLTSNSEWLLQAWWNYN